MTADPEAHDKRILKLREPLSCIKIALDEIACSAAPLDHAVGDIARAVAEIDREIEALVERDQGAIDSRPAAHAGALLEEVLRDLRPALAAACVTASARGEPHRQLWVDPVAWRGRCLDAFHAILEWAPPGSAVELSVSPGQLGAELGIDLRGDDARWRELRTALRSVPGVSARHVSGGAP